ncbi:MAG: response regulator transcription factor [Lysobacter sp.]|nr:response regulator transcription factor [Lysobacter sp.]
MTTAAATLPHAPKKAQSRVLVIEDDPDIAGMLTLHLRAEGFEIAVESSGEAGLERLRRERPDLLVLDLMLPGIDGLHVCRKVREGGDYLPIIILSAKSSETQRVVGLELGADDYLTKPFSMNELIARIHAVLRRMAAAAQLADQRAGAIRHGDLHIDPIAREVRMRDREIALTSKEFDLLALFARHTGRVFRRSELLDEIWGHTHDGYEHTVNTHINRLRAKIERDPANPHYILTVWGVGYRFSPSVQDAAGSLA